MHWAIWNIRELCEDALHRRQLSLQYHHTGPTDMGLYGPGITLRLRAEPTSVLSLYTHHIIKFADDTTLVGQVSKGTRLPIEMRSWDYQTTTWHSTPPKQRKSSLTSEGTDTAPLYIKCREGSDIQFLGTIISADLTWSANTAAVIKHFLRVLKNKQLEGEAAGDLLSLQWRARWDTVAQYGTAAVLRQREGLTSPVLSEGPLQLQLPQQSSEHWKRHCSTCCPPAGATGASRTNRLKNSFFSDIGFCDSAIAELSQNQANSAFFARARKFSYCRKFSADFGFRCVPWHHCNAHWVKERFSQFEKMEMNSLVFSSWPIYKSYSDKQLKAERILATRLGLSTRAGARTALDQATLLYTALGIQWRK